MTRWQSLNPTNLLCLVLLTSLARAHGNQSVAITLDPGQSIVETLQLTLPVVATTTAISMVTVTQMSMQTTTAVVMQMQTITVARTCAATTQVVASQSSQEVVTAGALDQVDSAASISSIAPSSVIKAGTSEPSATAAVPAASSALSEPCDCSCLCPMAAFPMAAYQMVPNATQTLATSSIQMSTFQTIASASIANKAVVSSSGGAFSASSATGIPSATIPSTSQMVSIQTLKPGVLPSVIVTDPGPATGQTQQKNAQDAPLNINNYSLAKSVSLPVIVGQAVEPTAGV